MSDLTARLIAELKARISYLETDRSSHRNESERWEIKAEQRDARIQELERWKAEALSVLDDWERLVYAKVKCRADQLGLTHAAVVADRIEELEAALRDLLCLADVIEGQLPTTANVARNTINRALGDDQ